MLKLIAFDAFGTLVDIFDKRHPFLVVTKAGVRRPDISPMTAPINLKEYAQLCGAPWNDSWADDLAAELASIAPYPETIDVLSAVREHGLKIALASNLAAPYGQPVIAQLGAWLDLVCFSFDLGATKPDAAFYLELCRRAGCAPAEVLMVGDTWRSDYAGATAAGMQAIHLDRRGRANPEKKAVSIRDLRELLPLLDRF
uniref:HAD family hydrolase n=1 Tax=Castellaniella defragrans TaxID=75697 RepID=UPI003342D8A5